MFIISFSKIKFERVSTTFKARIFCLTQIQNFLDHTFYMLEVKYYEPNNVILLKVFLRKSEKFITGEVL